MGVLRRRRSLRRKAAEGGDAAPEAQPTEKISVFASVLGGIDAQCASTDDEEQAEEQVDIAVHQVSGESNAQEQ